MSALKSFETYGSKTYVHRFTQTGRDGLYKLVTCIYRMYIAYIVYILDITIIIVSYNIN